MKLTHSNTQLYRLYPVALVFFIIPLLFFLFLSSYPLNLISFIFYFFFYFYSLVIKKVWLYYKLEDLFYKKPLFFTSKISEPFAVQDIETIKDFKKGKITKISLKDRRIIYVSFSSDEFRQLLIQQ